MSKQIQFGVGLVVLGLAAGVAGCGSGNEPLSILGDPAASQIGVLALPYTLTLGGVEVLPSTVTGYQALNTSRDGFDINSTSGESAQLLAAATGVVTAIDSSSITILHNTHVSSRYVYLASETPAVRVGDYVLAGTRLVSFTTGVNPLVVRFSVLVDGVAVCPYSYFTDTAKTTLNSKLSSFPCIQ
jgi:hypothetical protein